MTRTAIFCMAAWIPSRRHTYLNTRPIRSRPGPSETANRYTAMPCGTVAEMTDDLEPIVADETKTRDGRKNVLAAVVCATLVAGTGFLASVVVGKSGNEVSTSIGLHACPGPVMH